MVTKGVTISEQSRVNNISCRHRVNELYGGNNILLKGLYEPRQRS